MLRRQAEAELQPLRDVAAPGDVPQEEVAVLEAMLSAAMRVAADACDAPIEAAAAFLLGEPPGHPIPRVSLARQKGRGGSSKWVAGTRGERAISLKPSDYYHDAETIFTALTPAAAGSSPPVRLLDSDWLMERAARHLSMLPARRSAPVLCCHTTAL